MQSRTDCWDAAAKELLGYGLLFGREAFEHSAAVGIARA
jgi:hypothetical protein